MSQTPYSTPRKPQLVSINGSSKPSTVTVGTSSTLEIIPLGAGEEVGRSCIIVKYQGKTIMFDCGIYPANTGISSLPYFDSVDLSTVDLCLISHFHLDHVAALPYLTEKTDFRGRVLMTYPTKWISKLLLEDFIKMGKDRKADSAEQQLYSTEDVTASLERAEVLSYSQTTTINGIKVSCFCAGHVLGAALFMIEVDGVRVLYTGDFSSEKDRHLQPADVPPVSPDVIIVESTYGTTVHEDKNIREDKFTKFVHSVVENGGTCLVAVFALGRTQELILILEEYWAKHKELSRIPIYYTSKIAKKCLGYFKSCTNMMNDSIRTQASLRNPFDLRAVRVVDAKDIGQESAKVVIASPGTLQNGVSRDIFEKICGSERNGLIIPGYCVPDTLAKKLQQEHPQHIKSQNGAMLPVKCRMEFVSFSAHSDFKQTDTYLKRCKPSHVVLVHGEKQEMQMLAQKLKKEHKEEGMRIYTPADCQPVLIRFERGSMAKIVGKTEQSLSTITSEALLVKKDFSYILSRPEEVSSYTDIQVNRLHQRMLIPWAKGAASAHALLRRRLGPIETLKLTDKFGGVLMEWEGSGTSDAIADAAIAVLAEARGNAHEQQDDESSSPNDSDVQVTKLRNAIFEVLASRYGSCELKETGELAVTFKEKTCTLKLPSFEVSSDSKDFADEVHDIAVFAAEGALLPLEGIEMDVEKQ